MRLGVGWQTETATFHGVMEHHTGSDLCPGPPLWLPREEFAALI